MSGKIAVSLATGRAKSVKAGKHTRIIVGEERFLTKAR